ncbi:aldo/keto reductase [Halodesulfurarchaeum sp. HSR-GB]|uniref:aldo/keto reductase n=1 Tax=Halodesulfurarchaeum sp. HSR-GB TaxID=3074077 RepID=UPI002855AF3E|nr:aldo/keto reductase [Halodesulfurarchaeum sp. HSR-GB]MDR5657705.1 aldo/keto reductase [Halodesulfurarchaeum sp. HSR-GB]
MTIRFWRLTIKRDRTPAQAILRWAYEKDVVTVLKSTSVKHNHKNLGLFDWKLDPEDPDQIDNLDRGEPVYDARGQSWDDNIRDIPK